MAQSRSTAEEVRLWQEKLLTVWHAKVFSFELLIALKGEAMSPGPGSTSVVALLTDDFVICANAGDSRCVIASNNSCHGLSIVSGSQIF